MASYPPPPPPGNYPPPYDPRMQRRYLRDMARAQRQAARAHAAQVRYQMRAMRRGSILAPVLLISVGVIFLLMQTGRVDRTMFWTWYGQWWPLLLVIAGLVVLAEWAIDQHQMRRPGAPQYRRSYGGGAVLLLIVFGITGAAAAHATHRGDMQWMFGGMHMDPDSMDELFGDKHESDQSFDYAFPDGSSLTVVNPRGDVTISGTSDDGRVHVAEHKQVYARSDSDADSKAQQLAPQVQQPAFAGVGGLNITVPSIDGGRADLIIQVPTSAVTNVTANRGDLHISSIKGNVTATANRGDVELAGISGQAIAHINNSRASLTAHSIDGGLSVQGRAEDVTLSDITGPVTVSGDVFGTTHLAHINGPIHFHTGRSDFQVGRLDGQAEIQRDSDVTADQALGPLVLNTRNGNVTLQRIAGDVTVTNRNGTIDLIAAPSMGNILLEDRSGSVRATLPEGSGFSLEATTTNGNVDSDFQLSNSEESEKRTVRGVVGKGGPMVKLTTTDGDITLNKALVEPIPPALPVTPRISLTPIAPAAPKAAAAARGGKVPAAPKAPKVAASDEQ